MFFKKLIKKIILGIKYNNKHCCIKSYDISTDVKLGECCLIGKKTKISSNVEIGKFTYFNPDEHWIIIESNTKIGSFCSIAPGVTVGLGNHKLDNISTHPFLYNNYYLEKITDGEIKLKQTGLIDSDKSTIIGNDVWIGMNANIKRGIKIGNGAVVAMGAIVTKDVPNYAIVAGVPAKVIGYRFEKEDIEFLEQNPWWDWSNEKLIQQLDSLYNIEDYKKVEGCCK